NRSARLSAFEDFSTRSLFALSGLWTKLLYMAELRSEDGKHLHWGHSRAHGEFSSQTALAKVHSELYVELLRTSIPSLLAGMAVETDQPATLGERITVNQSKMIPEHLAGGSPHHFDSIVLIVRLLSADRQASNRPIA